MSRIDELAALTLELAQGAAEVVRSGRAEAFDVRTKSTSTDLVTEVDTRCEQWLVGEISRRRPDDAVLGEEGAGRDGTSGVRWVLDPIDGTVNFVLGLPQYAVSVAAELDGVIVAGAVANPATGETFHAALGSGAFLRTASGDSDTGTGSGTDQRLNGPRGVPLERSVVATGFSYDPGTRARQIAAVTPLLPQVADIRRLGAAALDLCFVAAGRLDAYFEAGLNLWDFAAGALVAAEAGCSVRGLAGAPASSRFLVASDPAVAPALDALLEQVGADRVRD